jgi:hypothetical protein
MSFLVQGNLFQLIIILQLQYMIMKHYEIIYLVLSNIEDDKKIIINLLNFNN